MESKTCASFRDAQGHEWHPFVTCGTLMDFEAATGGSIFDPKVLEGLQTGRKVSDLVTLAYLACPDDAKKYGMDIKQFAAAFHSLGQLHAMANVITEAIQRFFPSQTPSPNQASELPGAGASSTK